MMKRPFLAIGLLLLCGAAPATRPDDDSPAAQLKEWAKEKADDEKDMQSYRSLGKVSIRDIIQFHMDGDQILMDSPQLGNTDKVSFVLKELPGFGTFSILKTGDDPKSPVTGLMFLHRDYSHPGETIQTHVLFPTMQIARDAESPTLSVNISLIQNPAENDANERVRLNVAITDAAKAERKVDLRISAASLPALRREHPREVAKYLRPVLHDLRADDLLAIDPAMAWQVFAGSFVPPVDLPGKVNGLIARLDADALSERQGALKELQKLGPGAALMVMKMDRAKLSPEQNIALDAFVGPYAPLTAEELEKTRGDPNFLVDCLTCSDGQIRKLAADRLVVVLGHPLAYDPAGSQEGRMEAAEKIRARLPGAATQPGEGK